MASNLTATPVSLGYGTNGCVNDGSGFPCFLLFAGVGVAGNDDSEAGAASSIQSGCGDAVRFAII